MQCPTWTKSASSVSFLWIILFFRHYMFRDPPVECETIWKWTLSTLFLFLSEEGLWCLGCWHYANWSLCPALLLAVSQCTSLLFLSQCAGGTTIFKALVCAGWSEFSWSRGGEVYCFVKTTKPVQSSDREGGSTLFWNWRVGMLFPPYLTDLFYTLANRTHRTWIFSGFTLVIGCIFLASFSRCDVLHPQSDVLVLLFSPLI